MSFSLAHLLKFELYLGGLFFHSTKIKKLPPKTRIEILCFGGCDGGDFGFIVLMNKCYQLLYLFGGDVCIGYARNTEDKRRFIL